MEKNNSDDLKEIKDGLKKIKKVNNTIRELRERNTLIDFREKNKDDLNLIIFHLIFNYKNTKNKYWELGLIKRLNKQQVITILLGL